MYMKGFDALGNVAVQTISIALFKAPQSMSLSGKKETEQLPNQDSKLIDGNEVLH